MLCYVGGEQAVKKTEKKLVQKCLFNGPSAYNANLNNIFGMSESVVQSSAFQRPRAVPAEELEPFGCRLLASRSPPWGTEMGKRIRSKPLTEPRLAHDFSWSVVSGKNTTGISSTFSVRMYVV